MAGIKNRYNTLNREKPMAPFIKLEESDFHSEVELLPCVWAGGEVG